MSNIKYATTYNWCAPFELWAVLNNEFKFTLDPFKSFDVTDEEMLLSKAWDEKEVVFLLSTLWQKHFSVGRKMLSARQKWRSCSYAVTGKNRYCVVS